MARNSGGGPQLVGSARAQAGEVEIDMDDDNAAAQMIARTEDEIWREATALPDDDNSGDNSLERMDEGFDGETAEEVENEEVDAQAEDDDGLEASGEDDDDTGEEIEEEPARQAQPQPTRQQPPQRQPIADPNAERIARLEGELSALRAAQARPQPAAQTDKPAKPDMWSDPEGYEKWVLAEANRQAAETFGNLQFQDRMTRLSTAFDAAAQSDRGQEFIVAHRALSSGPPHGQPGFEQHAAIVNRVINSPDPVGSLFDWWEQVGGADQYQQNILAQAEAILGRQIAPRRGDRGDREQQPARNAGQRPRTTRSLNGQAGSGTHRTIDPEMYNGSESSVFDYATRN